MMKKTEDRIRKTSFFRFAIFMLIIAHCLLLTAYSQIAVKGETVWTMAGEPIKNGVVLINNGKIEAVGTEAQVKIPASYRVITAKVVTPGLIDAHTVVGLAGYMNQPHDQMQLEGSSPMQPELRATDAYNPDERLVEWLRGFGITTIHTGHSQGALISGQTMIVKTFGKTVDEAVIVSTAMIAANLGESALAGQGKSPGTRAKQVSMLRVELLKADAASKKTDAARDLRSEMFIKLLKREIPLMVTANRAQDIMTALRLAKEFNLRLVLDGAAESYLLINEIKAAGVPVIIHATMERAGGETENLSMETASKLKAAGIPVALQSGFESYVPKTRVVLFEAAIAAANGLSQRDALATITIDAAKLLGIEGRVGSLEVGKDGDVAMYDGDPFEYTSHCTGTIINGQVVSTVVR
jgi:imidazolonepropionase-like amidohydrolase